MVDVRVQPITVAEVLDQLQRLLGCDRVEASRVFTRLLPSLMRSLVYPERRRLEKKIVKLRQAAEGSIEGPPHRVVERLSEREFIDGAFNEGVTQGIEWCIQELKDVPDTPKPSRGEG